MAEAVATILVLDDDEGIVTLQRRALTRAGFIAIATTNVDEALGHVRGGRVDLVVLDYQLHGQVTGLAVYETLKAEGFDVPAIMVTGFSDERKAINALRAGFRDVIPKIEGYLELLPLSAGRVLRQMRAERQLAESEALRQSEERLRAALERAEEASRAKDQFLAILSHELRTPLTPVLAGIQLLEDEPNLPPDALEYVRLIRRNVELEARIIDDLLDLTRIIRGKVELQRRHLDAHDALRHVLADCGGDFDAKHIALRVDLMATQSHVDADPARLQQVLWNLLKNASKFTPDGGRVDVRTADTAGGLMLTVTDTGVGIEPAIIPTLFEPFEQGGREITRRYGGLGLGLSISRGLVERHGGTLTAASPGPGQGATFTLTLPTAEPARPAAAVAAPPAAAGQAAPLRVLLVEDHADTRHLMRILLSQSGYEVTTAENVAAAVAKADTPFDLLVSDIGLPDGTGLDVMRELSKRRPVRGIVMSGFGMEADIQRSRDAGFAEHLTKPVSADRLRAAIARLALGPSPGPPREG